MNIGAPINVCPACHVDARQIRANHVLKESILVGARWYCVDHGTDLLDYLDQHMRETLAVQS